MKKILLGASLLVGVYVVFSNSSDVEASQVMNRVYNPNSGEHFYTNSPEERDNLLKNGWKNEGTAWTAPDSGNEVFRLYNPNTGDHHYTLSSEERDTVVSKGWRYEGVGWYSGESGVPVYRAYNTNAVSGAHHFTTAEGEINNLVRSGWRNEGVAWYGLEQGTPPINGLDVEKTQQAIAEQTFNNINSYRENLGVQTLGNSPLLIQGAAVRADDMTYVFDHVRPDGTTFNSYIDRLGYSQYGAANGENIYALPYRTMNDTPDSYAISVIEAWKKSEGHKAILDEASSNDGAVGVKMVKLSDTSYMTYVVFVSGYNKTY